MCSLNATTSQLKVLENFFDGYCTLDGKNVEPHISKLNFEFQSYPKVPNFFDGPKEQYIEKFTPVLSLVTKLDFTFHEVIEAPGKVVLHFSVVIDVVDGTQFSYDSLSIFNLADEDGELKIASYKEFCDPEKRGKLLGWAAKILAEGAPVA